MELDKERLAKLLSLTESEHDGEALAAIRKANEVLRLHRTSWPEALGLVGEGAEPVPANEPVAERADDTVTAPPPRRDASLPSGFQRAAAYRAAFLREPLLSRLLGFPFWIVLEVLARLAPDKPLNVRGKGLTIIFAASTILGVLVWIVLAYVVLIGPG